VPPPRRQLLRLAAGAAVLPALARHAAVQAYPSRSVRIIVGLPPRLTPDIGARLVAQALSQHFGEPFIVDNRPGGAGNLATELVVRAAPDGIIGTLDQAIGAAVADPTVKARLVGLGIEPVTMTPDAFGRFMAGEVDKWAKVVKFAGIKPQ
jgi:tripartite-type tricarboxylate transporter receptor subunit TctC